MTPPDSSRVSRPGSPVFRRISPASMLSPFSLALLALWPWMCRHLPYLSEKPNSFLNTGTSTLIIAILVYSLNLAMGFSGLLSLMHTGLLGLGAYVGGVLANRYEVKFLVALPLAIVLCAAFSVFVTALSLRATYLYFGVITLSFNVFIAEIGKEWRSFTNGEDGLSGIPNPVTFKTWYGAQTRFFIVLFFLTLAIVFHRNVVRSKSGRALQALRESSETAAALGIRSATTKMTGAALSGGLAGVAGMLFAFHEGFINPSVIQPGDTVSLFGGLLLGGTATLAGPLVGVIGFTLLKEVIKIRLGNNQNYGSLILGSLLWLILMLIPKGLVGSFNATKFADRLRKSKPVQAADGDPLAWASTSQHTVDSEAKGLEPLLVARSVEKRFGGIKALQGVDVSVQPRQVHGIIGPNGSGKSTFVNCATAHLHRDGGTVELFGKPLPNRSDQVSAAGLVRVFQVPHLFEKVSVLDNVLTGMHLRSKQNWFSASLRLPNWFRDENALRREGMALLGLAGLADKADWLAGSLSHGQKRLLEVVRAVGAHPKILVLDEPATGLTAEEIGSLGQLMQTLKAGGLSIVLIEHNVEFVMGACDHITVFEQGRVIASGVPAEIRSDANVQRAYLGGGDVIEMMHALLNNPTLNNLALNHPSSTNQPTGATNGEANAGAGVEPDTVEAS
jgi:ABC-type branched-subunit amino acid transport system ATPase component/ABC-type branched-subunit amino acid transport system permease subunit